MLGWRGFSDSMVSAHDQLDPSICLSGGPIRSLSVLQRLQFQIELAAVNKDQLKQRIADFYQARLSNDAQACMAYFGKQVVFAFSNSDGTGPLRHRPQDSKVLLELVGQIVAMWRWQSLSDQVIVIDGNQAAVRYTVVVQFAASGREIQTQLMDHLIYDDAGQVIEFMEFADTALLNSVAAERDSVTALPGA